MELEISAIAGKYNTLYLLSDKGNPPLKHPLYSQKHLPVIRESEWFSPVVQYDKSGILNRLTDNQLMVVLYFYMNDNSRSATIMKQWLLDAACTEEQAEQLTATIYLARLDKDELPNDLLHTPVQESKPVQTSHIPEYNTIPAMLSFMAEGNGILWKFDQLPDEYDNHKVNNNLKVLDLSVTEETAMLVEDHHCIVAGYTVDMTSFTELISGEDKSVAKQLAGLVPLHLRDHYAAGQLFVEHPQVEELLLANRFSKIEHYALNSSGRLSQFSGPGHSAYHTGKLHETPGLLPFYIKLIKKQ